MTDKHSTLRLATLKDLQDILQQAAKKLDPLHDRAGEM